MAAIAAPTRRIGALVGKEKTKCTVRGWSLQEIDLHNARIPCRSSFERVCVFASIEGVGGQNLPPRHAVWVGQPVSAADLRHRVTTIPIKSISMLRLQTCWDDISDMVAAEWAVE